METFKTIKVIVRVNTFWWNFQGKFICILYTHLFIGIPTGLHNSLNPRMELHAGRSAITSEVMTLREARVIWRHLLTSLSQLPTTWNNLKGYNLLSWETTFPSTSGPSGWPSARPGCAWQWGHPHGQNISICHLAVCLSILVKQIFLIREENFLVWIRWFSSGAQRF